MDSTKFSKPISLKRIQLDGGFWKPEMELVRKEVIPILHYFCIMKKQYDEAVLGLKHPP